MSNNKEFYVWAMSECIKSTYEWWGIDMMSMYDNIKEDFPNAAEAIRKMHNNFDEEDYYEARALRFEHPQYIYQAIANLIPMKKELRFDTMTKELNKEYEHLNMCPWGEFVGIARIDLIMAILLFTEEFIFWPVTSKNVVLTGKKLIVYGNHVTFKISKCEKTTCVSIRIHGVMLFQYIMLN